MEAFQENPRGVLVSLEEDALAGLLFNIWFPYTKTNIIKIREGSFIAVKNFSGLTANPKYSILEIVSVLPVHYALGSTAADTERAYPGFVVEAAKAARQDWEQEEPLEQTTKIRTVAISSGWQMVFQNGECVPAPDESMPMIGEEVFLLTNKTTDSIVNKGFAGNVVPNISPCWLVQNNQIKVCIGTDDLLRTHFGVFGFTGSGKSNLYSTIVYELMKSKGLKIVLYDLMLEYTALLIDVLSTVDGAFLLFLDEDSLPGGDLLEQALRGRPTVEGAVRNITSTLLMPRELAPSRHLYSKCFETLLKRDKFKVRMISRSLTGEVLHGSLIQGKPADSRLGTAASGINEWLGAIQDMGDTLVTQEQLTEFCRQVQDFISFGMPLPDTTFGASPPKGAQKTLADSESAKKGVQKGIELSTSASGYLIAVRKRLMECIEQPDKNPLRPDATISMAGLVQLLNDNSRSALVIVQSGRDDTLRRFSSELAHIMFNDRKRRGANSPQVLFMYDEADEFMPNEAPDESYKFSKSAITMLARRGRKFGLGLSFATQRVAYLDTSILAQAHTYLISKLPRQYDRKTVSDAFGLSEDMLLRTLKFAKGQWLLVSYEATGLENVPLPVQFPNANLRVSHFLEKCNSKTGQEP